VRHTSKPPSGFFSRSSDGPRSSRS